MCSVFSRKANRLDYDTCKQLPRTCYAAVIVINIAKGGNGGFREIRNTYVRMVDSHYAKEEEIWRIPLSQVRSTSKICFWLVELSYLPCSLWQIRFFPKNGNPKLPPSCLFFFLSPPSSSLQDGPASAQKNKAAAMVRLERDPSDVAAGWRAVTLGSFPIPRAFGMNAHALPKAIVISEVGAYIPAMDKTGKTGKSDPYLRITFMEYQTVKSSMMGSSSTKDVKVDLVKTTPQLNVPCPALVSFGIEPLRIPITTLQGSFGKCSGKRDFKYVLSRARRFHPLHSLLNLYAHHCTAYARRISVYDKDKLSSDDLILQTDIELAHLFGESDVEVLDYTPSFTTNDYPRPQAGGALTSSTQVNANFRSTQMKLKLKLTLEF